MPRPPYASTRSTCLPSIRKSLEASIPSNQVGQTLSSGGEAKNREETGYDDNQRILHNPPPALIYEEALKNEKGTIICSNGALAAFSGAKTGRSPKDKRVVAEPSSEGDVWWGPVNFKLEQHSFLLNRERAIDYLNTQNQLFVIDGFAGWDTSCRLKVRVICSRGYHALFMWNMMIRPTDEELANFGEPDFTIYNAGCFPANRYTKGMGSSTSVAIDFARHEMVILGTQYAGEMKKGILTVMMYLMPKQGQLCLHSSCNEGPDGDTTLFFGLSGTGKTTLSADPRRRLLGDDEHVWGNNGVFNVEGGCYAKCIGLSPETEPEIYNALRFGAILENVVVDDKRDIDYNDLTITENTRCAYPLEFIPNSKLPAIGNHPNNVVLLTCDAFGVLPPVAKLTIPQTMYQFISGYTSKIPGTETGVTEPLPTFSACFGGPFLVWHPTKYAEMLAEKLGQHQCNAWLVNTGWVGGMAGTAEGSRIKLRYTRAMVDAINNGTLAKIPMKKMPGFDFEIPESCPGVPPEVLLPWTSWKSFDAYKARVTKLAGMFRANFEQYKAKATPEVLAAEPKDWTD